MTDPAPAPLELDPKYDDFDFPTTAAKPMSGHSGYLNPTQQAQVHQLRMMLEAQGVTERLDTLTLVSFPRSGANDNPQATTTDRSQPREGDARLTVPRTASLPPSPQVRREPLPEDVRARDTTRSFRSADDAAQTQVHGMRGMAKRNKA